MSWNSTNTYFSFFNGRLLQKLQLSASLRNEINSHAFTSFSKLCYELSHYLISLLIENSACSYIILFHLKMNDLFKILLLSFKKFSAPEYEDVLHW